MLSSAAVKVCADQTNNLGSTECCKNALVASMYIYVVLVLPLLAWLHDPPRNVHVGRPISITLEKETAINFACVGVRERLFLPVHLKRVKPELSCFDLSIQHIS